MRAYKLLLWKAYFDKGWSLTNQFKYVVAFLGLFNLVDVEKALWLIGIYLIGCLVVGWVWFNSGLIDTENEVQNHFNPFQREVREKLHTTTLSKTFK